ncbi:MAG: DUF2635 domain-containing protein [Planctomycetota bacterium]|jgi:hypothetical protein
MPRLFLVPVKGRNAPNPDTGRPLASDGEYVEASQYWRRRVLAGDAEELKPPHENGGKSTRPRRRRQVDDAAAGPVEG